MYEDIKAARILGTDEDTIQQRMSKRGERRAFNSLIEGEFRPLTISTDVKQLFEARFSELGLPNAFDQAADAILTIKDILRTTPLSYDALPTIPNPFKTSVIPNLVGQVNNMISPTANLAAAGGGGGGGTGFVGQGNINIDPASGLTLAEEIYFDPLEKIYRRNQRKTNTNQTKLA